MYAELVICGGTAFVAGLAGSLHRDARLLRRDLAAARSELAHLTEERKTLQEGHDAITRLLEDPDHGVYRYEKVVVEVVNLSPRAPLQPGDAGRLIPLAQRQRAQGQDLLVAIPVLTHAEDLCSPALAVNSQRVVAILADNVADLDRLASLGFRPGAPLRTASLVLLDDGTRPLRALRDEAAVHPMATALSHAIGSLLPTHVLPPPGAGALHALMASVVRATLERHVQAWEAEAR